MGTVYYNQDLVGPQYWVATRVVYLHFEGEESDFREGVGWSVYKTSDGQPPPLEAGRALRLGSSDIFIDSGEDGWPEGATSAGQVWSPDIDFPPGDFGPDDFSWDENGTVIYSGSPHGTAYSWRLGAPTWTFAFDAPPLIDALPADVAPYAASATVAGFYFEAYGTQQFVAYGVPRYGVGVATLDDTGTRYYMGDDATVSGGFWSLAPLAPHAPRSGDAGDLVRSSGLRFTNSTSRLFKGAWSGPYRRPYPPVAGPPYPNGGMVYESIWKSPFTVAVNPNNVFVAGRLHGLLVRRVIALNDSIDFAMFPARNAIHTPPAQIVGNTWRFLSGGGPFGGG